MKVVRSLLVLCFLTLPLLAASRLGDYTGVAAQVPFDFEVGSRTVPAGHCIVRSNDTVGTTILIRNPEAKVDVLSTASAEDSRHEARASVLVFHKYGERYFLAEIRLAGMQTVFKVPQSRAEADLRHKTSAPERVELPL